PREGPPLAATIIEHPPSLGGEPIDPPPAPARSRPATLDEPRLLQAVKGRVDSALRQVEGSPARLAQRLDDHVAVRSSAGERGQQHAVKMSLQGLAAHT